MKPLSHTGWLCALALLLVSCTTYTTPVHLPAHPLFVIAGQYALPGHAHSTVSVVDRQNFKAIGSRDLRVSFINEALYDGTNLWYGYAGDIDVDMHSVAKLSPDLAKETMYDVCTEPNGVHDDGDALIVLCTVNGMVAHATRISKATGRIEAETDVVTKWGDMMYVDSVLFNGELLVYGGGDYASASNRTAQELQVRNPKTLELLRIIETPKTELGMTNILVHDGALYILNMASKYAAEFNTPEVDLLRYTTGATAVEILPNIARSPTVGTIRGDDLFTVHNIGNNMDFSTVTIARTNLKTMEHKAWKFDGHDWSYINDIENIDGHLILAVPRMDNTSREGLYEFDPTTGALTLVSAIPGASLIVDSQPTR